MSRQLKTFVTVHDENGADHTFGPSDKVPAWARESISNPNVWADEKADAPTDGVEPPRQGTGSGKGAWAAYAEAAGLSVPEGASAKDIQAIVDAVADLTPSEDDDEDDEESDSNE